MREVRAGGEEERRLEVRRRAWSSPTLGRWWGAARWWSRERWEEREDIEQRLRQKR